MSRIRIPPSWVSKNRSRRKAQRTPNSAADRVVNNGSNLSLDDMREAKKILDKHNKKSPIGIGMTPVTCDEEEFTERLERFRDRKCTECSEELKETDDIYLVCFREALPKHKIYSPRQQAMVIHVDCFTEELEEGRMVPRGKMVK